ncbi:hypothetical protein BV394_04190 [Brevirhabdus pacifica]|uniref:L,D-TPase catalytic domain-containing protein n=1 Tax=Brevirhabdus pacifica TaxID=1267768 RepID=A0A1U7DLT1_9RHOB|nr:hypothetical protein BV394_04190 [Brevirhabdus pacifica]OWU80405.1 ErfK/YbiS/YcfS/YnhG [Loktanella sp. 22II-4b]
MTKRQFLAGLAAVPFSAGVARAHKSKPFVLEDRFKPQIVRVKADYAPGDILVVPQEHFLYLVTEPGKAIRYGVGVGKAGLEFKGSAVIERKAEWPSWRPTDAMIERDPDQYAQFADGVPGGPTNPLGSRALYLYQNGIDTYYRIHGTTQPSSIGRSVSNGCIRMLNSHVQDLYERVPLGTRVHVF